MSKRFVVFERTQGSKSWTIAFQTSKESARGLKDGYGDFDVPACFHLRELADKFVSDVQSKRLGWWGGKPDQRPMESHVAEIDLP